MKILQVIIRRFISPAVFLALAAGSYAEETKVIMQVDKALQPDSFGTNIADCLPAFVYRQVMGSNLKLWDSPKKEIEITPETLSNIEKSSNTKFGETFRFFIYEIWMISKKELRTKTVGFSFVNESEKHEPVSYGYIDYADVEEMFRTSMIPAGADGSYSTTFSQRLGYRKFYYDLIQFGNERIRDAKKSMMLKDETFSGRQFITGVPPVTPDKYIIYTIENTTSFTGQSVENSRGLFESLTSFFSANMEELLNAGGDRFVSHFRRDAPPVTRVQVSSLWVKLNGRIIVTPLSVTIFVSGVPLNPLSMEDMRKWDVFVGFKSLEDFLKENSTFYVISRINNTEIEPRYSESYRKALLETSSWPYLGVKEN